jgi:hypothetical protein
MITSQHMKKANTVLLTWIESPDSFKIAAQFSNYLLTLKALWDIKTGTRELRVTQTQQLKVAIC